MLAAREKLKSAKRIVIKVGTSSLTYSDGKLNIRKIDRLAMVLADLTNNGKEVILVTSGAIGVGAEKLNFHKKPETLGEKQAAAAVGQCELMHIYSKMFSEYGSTVGQILLTRDVVENKNSRRNVINTFENLFKCGVIPIVNENDSVAVDEIEAGEKKRFSENDSLSAIVAVLLNADILIILTDIDGLYTEDPRKNSDSELIDYIKKITPEIENYAGGNGSKFSTGGMVTKLLAAKTAMNEGVAVVLANGEKAEILYNILNGEIVGTLFSPR